MLGQYGTRVPFFVAAGLTLVNVLMLFYSAVITPKRKQASFDIKRTNPFVFGYFTLSTAPFQFSGVAFFMGSVLILAAFAVALIFLGRAKPMESSIDNEPV